MGDRTRFIEYQGRRIVLMDFSNITEEDEAARALDEARALIAAQPKERRLLLLVRAQGAIANGATTERLKGFVAHNTPYVLASAVVGVSPLLRLVLRIVVLFSGRKLATFVDEEQAKVWLVSQKAPPTQVPEEFAPLSD